MATCLYETVRIADFVIIPHFVMNMRAGAAAGGPKQSNHRALADLRAQRDGYLRKMTIACMNSKAMINFDHVAVTAAIACEYHLARRGRGRRGAPWSGEIHAGMESVMVGEGIDPRSEADG